MSRNNTIAVIIFAVLAAGAAGFLTFRSSTSDVKSQKTSDVFPRNMEEGNSISDGIKPPAPAPQNDELNALKTAALERKIPTGNEAATKELKDLSSQLKSEPNYIQGWLQLGILRKYLGDYEGASLAWQYATFLRPQDYIAFSNLGDLYHYYLRDFPKAERYLRKAVDVKPDYVAGYKNIFDLYMLSYKEKENLAEPVLLEGIKKNPDDHYLETILVSYKNDNQR